MGWGQTCVRCDYNKQIFVFFVCCVCGMSRTMHRVVICMGASTARDCCRMLLMLRMRPIIITAALKYALECFFVCFVVGVFSARFQRG